MTDEELSELVDLSIDGDLPLALRGHVEAYLATHPEAARDADRLRETVARLRAAPAERPDDWFVERTLDRLLQEHAAAQSPQSDQSDLRIHSL